MKPTIDVEELQSRLEEVMRDFFPKNQQDAEEILQRLCNLLSGTIAWEAMEHFNETGHKTCWVPTVDRCRDAIKKLVIIKLNEAFEGSGVEPIKFGSLDEFLSEVLSMAGLDGEEIPSDEDPNAELRREIEEMMEQEEDDADVCSKPH